MKKLPKEHGYVRHTSHLGKQATAAVKAVVDPLVPIALATAHSAGKKGITVADVKATADRMGYGLGSSDRKTLSGLGGLMKAAKLVPTSSLRRSSDKAAHGRYVRVWLHPAHVEQKG